MATTGKTDSRDRKGRRKAGGNGEQPIPFSDQRAGGVALDRSGGGARRPASERDRDYSPDGERPVRR